MDNNGVVQDHWTAEDIEELLPAARAVNSDQKQAAENLGIKQESIRKCTAR